MHKLAVVRTYLARHELMARVRLRLQAGLKGGKLGVELESKAGRHFAQQLVLKVHLRPQAALAQQPSLNLTGQQLMSQRVLLELLLYQVQRMPRLLLQVRLAELAAVQRTMRVQELKTDRRALQQCCCGYKWV